MVVLISGVDRQLYFFKSVLRGKTSFDWYTYDWIPKKMLEYLDIGSRECDIDSKDRRLLKDLTEALERHSDLCFKDCLSVIDNYKVDSSAKYLFIVIPNQKINKFKDVDAIKVNVINDPNLVSGNIKYKHSLYDYVLYNAHDRNTMNRKVSDFLRFLEQQESKNEDN